MLYSRGMMAHRALAPSILLAWRLAAQAPPNGVVDVSVSRTILPGASEALFTVDAAAPSSNGVFQVTALLEPVGVRAEHLRRAAFQREGLLAGGAAATAIVTYSFELRVPASRLEALSLEMDRLFHKPPAPLTRFSFGARLLASAAELEKARMELLPVLFEEARAKAEATLAAAGQTPGPVLALFDQIDATGYDASATAKLWLRMGRAAPGPSGGRSVAAMAARAITAPFDNAVASLATNAGAEQSIRALSPLGITAANLVSQSSSLNAGLFGSNLTPRTSFEVTMPAGELPRFIDAFAKLEREGRGIGFDFYALLAHSGALRDRERTQALPVLLAEARRRAEPLARLLNLPLGGPRLIVDEEFAAPGTEFFAAAGFSSFLLGLPGPVVSSSNTRPITLSVEFAVD